MNGHSSKICVIILEVRDVQSNVSAYSLTSQVKSMTFTDVNTTRCNTNHSNNPHAGIFHFEMNQFLFLCDEVVLVIRVLVLNTGPNTYVSKNDN